MKRSPGLPKEPCGNGASVAASQFVDLGPRLRSTLSPSSQQRAWIRLVYLSVQIRGFFIGHYSSDHFHHSRPPALVSQYNTMADATSVNLASQSQPRLVYDVWNIINRGVVR